MLSSRLDRLMALPSTIRSGLKGFQGRNVILSDEEENFNVIDSRWFIVMNYLVHSVMYTYYAFKAMR